MLGLAFVQKGQSLLISRVLVDEVAKAMVERDKRYENVKNSHCFRLVEYLQCDFGLRLHLNHSRLCHIRHHCLDNPMVIAVSRHWKLV
jgi:hypothetical protein